MEGNGKKEENGRGEIHSVAVRAGKRTYFFDVKATRQNEHYLTMTERTKRYQDDGSYTVEKHKIFLYKEDFEKFKDGFLEAVDFIGKLENQETEKEKELELAFADVSYSDNKVFTDLEFEDLIN